MGVLTAQSLKRRPRPCGSTPRIYLRVEFSVPRPQISLRGVRVHQNVARQDALLALRRSRDRQPESDVHEANCLLGFGLYLAHPSQPGRKGAVATCVRAAGASALREKR